MPEELNQQQPNTEPEGAAPNTGGSPTEPNGQEPQGQPEPNQQPPQEGQEPNRAETFDRKYVEKLRDEAAANRTKAKEHEEAVAAAQAEKDALIQQIGKAFGFVKDEDAEQADAQKLVEQITGERDTLQQELRSLRQENALSSAINGFKVDGQRVPLDTSLTLAVIKGTGALDGLDPTAEDFSSQVEQRLSGVVEKHPQLRTQVVPKSSGQSPTPTENKTGKLTEDDLSRLAQDGKWDEINKAAAEGRIS